MIPLSKKKIVLLGMYSKMPVAGVAWLVAQYMVGFRRLGYDAYYVEAHARTPSMFMKSEEDDASAQAAALIESVMRRFDMNDRWAFHALHDDGRCFGLSENQLKQLYQSADLIINLHGGTVPQPEHSATEKLIYLETDPVELEVELYNKDESAIEFISPHTAFFTWGLNYGNPDCKVPVPENLKFKPSPPPVIVDFWKPLSNGAGQTFTTIGNWRQTWNKVNFQGEVYHWSKHYEFLKFIDLPARTNQAFELALSSYDEDDKTMLEGKGWKVRHAMEFSVDMDSYRRYIIESHGEFTVAKDQNVRLRSGWFSERSATYLAAGRPVITQDTGFSNYLPTGDGLFSFSTIAEIEQAIDSINSNYEHHCRAAYEIARDYFNYDVVLKHLLTSLGL
ncbi:MAG: hypothetical protein M3362_27920 [Acidobacteriota bacterium]|nr:hypothetical protein [Acidobacteriota bacterium]